MSDYALPRHRTDGRHKPGGRLLVGVLIGGMIALATAPAAYMMWPRWPDTVDLDAPALPITVGNVVFNVPPAAIRVKMQRRPGAQPRLDLAFLWPSLMPPDPAAKPVTGPQALSERVFVTIAPSDGTLPPTERLNLIYPRYLAPDTQSLSSDGLVIRPFRKATPYDGEDLLYDANAVERFLLRCTRKAGDVAGMCLHERRIAGVDLTVRFPRDWLADWQSVAQNLERLIGSLRPMPNG